MATIADVFEVPLKKATPQKFNIQLQGQTYNFTIKWNDMLYGGGLPNPVWYADIYDNNNKPLVLGVPFVTGADLLEQFGYLGIGGGLVVQSDNDPGQVPGYETLGVTGHLYFVNGLRAPTTEDSGATATNIPTPDAGPRYREIDSLPATVVAGDEVLGIDTAALAQAIVIVLPPASTRVGVPLTFKDISRKAGQYNITLQCNGLETIDPPGGAGSANTKITVNGASVQLLPVTGGWVRLG